ncbi:MAG: hypothetical protein GY847_07220 [Proteobacteria bacterium]|nr:hypothetical protein [Pseudomonadota bacterium]
MDIPNLKQMVRIKLEKIKGALAQETEQTKEMLDTYQRFVKGQASKDEMERANTQFKDILKTLGLGVLAVLPLSPITIPAIVSLGKKYGIEVLPDSFKEMDQD